MDELLTANRNTSWLLRQRQIYGRQARIIAKHHKDRWTKLVSCWNPARSTKQQGHRKQGRQVDRTTSTRTYNHTAPIENNDITSDITWLTATKDTSKWDALDSDIMNSRLKRPARPTTSTNKITTTVPATHEKTTCVTDAHDQNEDDTKDDDFSLSSSFNSLTVALPQNNSMLLQGHSSRKQQSGFPKTHSS